MIKLFTRAEEGSSYPIRGIQFLDEVGSAVTPNEDPTWTMCDESGTKLFSGSISKAGSMDLILSGDQLVITASELSNAKYDLVFGKKKYYVVRTLTLTGYVTTTILDNEPITQQFIFIIDNIDGIG